MKVVDIISSDLAFLQLGNRLKRINEAGIENSIVFPTGYSNDKFKSLGIPFVLYDKFADFSFRPSYFLRTSKELSEIISDLKPDIIHTHDSKAGTFGRVAGRKARVPIVIHQVHGFHFTKQQGMKKKIFEIVEKRLSKITDLILFQNWTDYRTAELTQINRTTKLLYIGNGISFHDISIKGTDDRVESPASIGKLVIGCVARFDSVKNHGMLFEALCSVKTHVPFELHLFGDGPLIEKYKELVRESSIESRVVFHGFIDKLSMIETLKKCNLSVLVSKGEGKPRSLMESSYLGLPIIGTDVVGTNEVVKDGENGFLIQLNDAKALANKLELLYNDETLWRYLSANAKTIAREEFDENRIVDRLLLIYKMLYENRIDELIEAIEGGKAWQNVSL